MAQAGHIFKATSPTATFPSVRKPLQCGERRTKINKFNTPTSTSKPAPPIALAVRFKSQVYGAGSTFGGRELVVHQKLRKPRLCLRTVFVSSEIMCPMCFVRVVASRAYSRTLPPSSWIPSFSCEGNEADPCLDAHRT